MSQVDWSKAPEGTSHRLPDQRGCSECWIRATGSLVFYAYDRSGPWIEWSGSEHYRDKWVARPSVVAWSGEGLPPVNTVCLLSGPTQYLQPIHPEWAGRQVKIYAHFTTDAGIALAAYASDDNQIGGVGIARLFVPIRTAEQIAAEEREKAVEAMLALDPYIPNTTLGMMSRADFCRALHEDGYRKKVAP